MSRRAQKNVGVIGLGIIGRRVADSLRRRGFHVFVWNRTPRPFPNFVGTPEEIAQLCDFIQIFVSNDDALISIIEQLKRSLKPHHVVMAHSTVAPATMRAAAEIVHRRGAQLLDAPFTGSKMAAEKGELVYYIGGDDAAFRRARAVLEASSKELVEIGEIGDATTIKVATNMITAATVQAAAEALALVKSAGVGVEKFAEAMRGNASNSGTLALKLPKMLDGDFEPHFSVKHMLKDVLIAVRMGQSYGLSLPGTSAARDGLLNEVRQGREDADYSSVVQAYFPGGAVSKPPEPEAVEQVGLALEERVEEPPAAEPQPEPAAEPEREIIPEPVTNEEPKPEDELAPQEHSDPAPEPEPQPEPEPNPEPAPQPADVLQLPVSSNGEEAPAADASAADAPAADAPAPEPPAEAPSSEPAGEQPKQEEEEPRRSFFSRMFGRAGDS
jgi:3-hydroxyisobutyrate dehydrogenase-like beta-hydroxyacid dehydrogenase